MRLSPPVTFADAPVFLIKPPAGFKALRTVAVEQCTITIVYDRGLQSSKPRQVTPRALLQSHGIRYLLAYCHRDGCDKTFSLDRIQECWLEARVKRRGCARARDVIPSVWREDSTSDL